MSSNNDLINTFLNICQNQINTTRELSNDLITINNIRYFFNGELDKVDKFV